MSKLISLLLPVYNEADVIDLFFEQTMPVLESLDLEWEVVSVNDGSSDATLERLWHWHDRDSRIKVINLSRNFGKERALTAALDFALGDAVIPIDVDLQDPPGLIPRMVEQWLQGYDVVNAVRQTRNGDSIPKRTMARSFYKVINLLSDVEIPRDVGDFRLLSKRVCDVLRAMRENHRFMKGLFSWPGFSTTTIYFERPSRSGGQTKWSYWHLWNLALEGITSFSTIPLKIASYLGLATAGVSLMYAAFLIVRTLIIGDPVRGYPSLMTAILFFGGVQLIFIGVIGEYVARVHDEVKGRPIYVIESTRGIKNPTENQALDD